MIERVTICLENGGKHVLRVPKQPFRTHRSLHSAFWYHGAGDIDLPAWWHAFLQVPSLKHSKWLSNETSHGSHKIKSDKTHLGFLDFLYPGRTLAFIRKYVNEHPPTPRRHRRSHLLIQRSRNYTSTADSGNDLVTNTKEDTGDVGTEDAPGVDSFLEELSHLTKDELVAKLHELLFGSEHVASIQDIWQLYGRLHEMAVSLSPGDLGQLFKRLSDSPGTFGLEKTRHLFDTILPSERRSLHYNCAIAAALRQKDLRSAVAIHAEAADRIDGSFGSSLVFKYAIEHADWEAALAVWEQHGETRRLFPRESTIWEGIDQLHLPQLLEHAKGAVRFAVSCIEASSLDEAAPARKLASAIVERVMNIHDADFDPFLQAELVEKAQSIQQPGPSLFQAAILQNLSVATRSNEYRQWAIKLYCVARTNLDFMPGPKLLLELLKHCHSARQSDEMYYILEDYRKNDIDLPRQAYRLLMSQLARHGDFDTVQQLFQEWSDRFGVTEIPRFAPYLLHACYRRADVDRAFRVIEDLQQRYAYHPDLRAWNILFATYARVGDCDGAMALLDKIANQNICPDSTTYAILMGMYAKRSDYEATETLYEQALSEDIQPTLEMVGHLVLALAANNRLDEAESLAEQTLKMGLEALQHQPSSLSGDHSRKTRVWNALLAQHAMKGHLDKVFELQNRMREAGINFDGYTYAALMQSLCIKKMPDAASKILKVVMPQAGLRVTAFHYAIVMGGYLNVRDYFAVFSLQRRMVEDNNIKPTRSTQNVLLRSAAMLEDKADNQRYFGARKIEYFQAEAVLAQTLDNLDPMELASVGPTKFAQSNSPDVAFQASYFPYLVNLYGRRRSFDKVAEMYDKYSSTSKRFRPNAEIRPAVEMLSALMAAYTVAGEHDEAEKCWSLAFEKSKDIARKANASTSKPGWVLYKYRFLLSLPLTQYMQTLSATSRVDSIGPLISSLQEAGFALSTHNWNKYVQILVKSEMPVLAYQICENQLIQGWPGWERFGHHISIKARIKRQWVPRSWELGRPFPHYETLVFLASAYLDAQGKAYGVGRGLLGELEKVAPRTLETVYKMPRFDDKIQNALLIRDN